MLIAEAPVAINGHVDTWGLNCYFGPWVFQGHATGSMLDRVTCVANEDHGDIWIWAAAKDHVCVHGPTAAVECVVIHGPYCHQGPHRQGYGLPHRAILVPNG